ncbi:MAG TPA: phosphoribosyltransferase family protein [Candidatus Pristimantibacillus sp.]|jgi:predicted phosphoribosyltransferase|nr:phosphoribosyltransferase family protein [Candidatus Pristimantibacillus sp.]
MHFKDRKEAGELLADALMEYKDTGVVVYALPRGGVILGAEIARRLKAPLDIVVPRKIGHPDQPEYGVCAVTEDGHLVCSKDEIAKLSPAWLTAEVQKEQATAQRRFHDYLADRTEELAEGKTAIIVDDGVATGLTMLAAIEEVKDRGPERVVLAAPVIPGDIADRLKRYVDELVALDIPAMYLGTVGAYYDDFDRVKDKTVTKLLSKQPAPSRG